jgi:hypothetical protein
VLSLWIVSQEKVFEVLYKIAELPFLAKYKSQIDVRIRSIHLILELEPRIFPLLSEQHVAMNAVLHQEKAD